MVHVDEADLASLLASGIELEWIEPHLYAVSTNTEIDSSYDKRFGDLYERVACNPIYNRLLWGYTTAKFASLADDALRSSKAGWVLDLGCGSLAFTARSYIRFAQRPVVLLDQSLKLLRRAKAKLTDLNGTMPAHMVFVLGDALQLPFKPRSFQTIISLNLLHVIGDIRAVLAGSKHVLASDGRLYMTTLVKGGRLADRYLALWEKAGEVVARDKAQLAEAFQDLQMQIALDVNGSMAFVRYDGNAR
jgi:ubiquinone/menaquinone biosynthesis C-methylase UbiE